jgi:hypothetical protein
MMDVARQTMMPLIRLGLGSDRISCSFQFSYTYGELFGIVFRIWIEENDKAANRAIHQAREIWAGLSGERKFSTAVTSGIL